MLKFASIFSRVSVGWGDALAPGSPFKERDTWEGMTEAMEMKCTNNQKELLALYEEFKDANSLQETVKVHDSPSTLATRVTELEGSLKDVEDKYEVSSDSIKEKALKVENYRKDAEALKALQDKIASLEWALHDTLGHIMHDVFRVRE